MNLTSPSQVKAWCIENGFHPNKALGQNFLVDRHALEAIVAAAEIDLSQGPARILEIGPGLGVLTEALLATGAEVIAIEKDRRLAERLAEALGNPPRLQVITADALTVDWPTLLKDGFQACVSNLPYSVGTRILLDVAFQKAAPKRFVLLVQTEVAERFAAQPGTADRGQAGVWLQLDYDVSLVRTVDRGCFWPKPEVESTVVRLDAHPCPLSEAERECYFALSRQGFMHRRKQLGSLLRRQTGLLACTDEVLAQRLAAAGLEPRIRPEELTVGQWTALSKVYAEG